MTSPHLRLSPPWFGATAGLFLASLVAPRLTYALGLALFSVPHVFAELRYVDRRFTERLPRGFLLALLVPLLAICGLRLVNVLSPGSPQDAPQVELTLVAVLLFATVPILVGRNVAFLTLAALSTAALGLVAWKAPAAALVTFAFLHNLTPVLFLMERLEGQERRRFLGGPALVSFLLVPLLLATGLAQNAIGGALRAALDRDWLGIGSLEDHFGVFVPEFLEGGNVALHLFQAAAMLQGLHYLYVLRVLPRLVEDGTPRTLVQWPDSATFTRALLAMGTLGLALFAISFLETRKVYGVLAAFHAWVEWPLLLVGLSGVLGARSPSSSETGSHA